MKKLFFFFLMMLLPMAGSAHDAIIDGIYYLFDQKAMTATVTYDHFQLFKYSGEVVIPETVAYEGKSYCVAAIGNQAFYNNKELYSVIIPNSVISIGFQAFYGCSELCAINISDSVKDISMEAFESTRWYNSQPDGLVYAGKVAYKFKGTMQATDIVLKEGTTGIAGNANDSQYSETHRRWSFPELQPIVVCVYHGCCCLVRDRISFRRQSTDLCP